MITMNREVARATNSRIRELEGLTPATYNYEDPTQEMLDDPFWNAIWDEIKTWDIAVPTEYHGYTGATGNHATAIYKAIHASAMTENNRIPDCYWSWTLPGPVRPEPTAPTYSHCAKCGDRIDRYGTRWIHADRRWRFHRARLEA